VCRTPMPRRSSAGCRCGRYKPGQSSRAPRCLRRRPRRSSASLARARAPLSRGDRRCRQGPRSFEVGPWRPRKENDRCRREQRSECLRGVGRRDRHHVRLHLTTRELPHESDAVGDSRRRLVAHHKSRRQDRALRGVIQDKARELRRRRREREGPSAAADRGLGDRQGEEDGHLRQLYEVRERVVVIDSGPHDDRVGPGFDRLASKLERRFRGTAADVHGLQLHA